MKTLVYVMITLLSAAAATITLPAAARPGPTISPAPSRITLYEHDEICRNRCRKGQQGRYRCPNWHSGRVCKDDSVVVDKAEVLALIQQKQSLEVEVRRMQARIGVQEDEKRFLRDGKKKCKIAHNALLKEHHELDAKRLATRGSGLSTVTVTAARTF
ncbi:hypothetical protein CAC42_7950 [Sphaceloma murrayae]|uniref:Uncharacterized protein n=1 Tax=Sphaceloma murrayae TaxID=2082308 RepID=A0A2K1QYJ8_9PEZI|nr:hypothetical protein CAC42_7950 [Sphaceloma murrayae]